MIAKIEKGNKTKDVTKKFLGECKLWGSPFTTVKELEQTLYRRTELQEFIIKTEMAYYVKTHKSEKLSRPDLFRLNGISHAEKLENLLLVSDNYHTEKQKTIANLPSNIDVMKASNINLETLPDKSSNSNTVN